MLKNKTHKYPILIRILHWVMALIIISMIAIGWYMQQLPDDAVNKYSLYPWHKSFGMLLLFLWPIRTLIKAVARKPPYYGLSDQQLKITVIAHYVLYLLMLLVPVSGYLMSSAGGYGVKMFGIPMPNLLGENKFVAELAHEVHEWLPWILLILIGIHIAAVIRHHIYDRVNILKRML